MFSVAEAVRKIHEESGCDLPKSYSVVIDDDWAGKRNFRSLDKASDYIDSLGRVAWELVDGKTGCSVANRVHIMNWIR